VQAMTQQNEMLKHCCANITRCLMTDGTLESLVNRMQAPAKLLC
jgi:hypothetical protein